MPWQPGQPVRHIDDPAKTGTVTDQTRARASGPQYRVNWNGRFDWHYEDELIAADTGEDDPLELIREARYGRVDDLRRLLTHVHLAGRLANVVYAMGLSRTDFYPHQYKPLLTLLDSPVNGLLIADEVGLGKTIEAGLIWTELRARHDMRRLLVVCPAMLCEKWRMELSSRFGLDARVVKAGQLRQELESGDRNRERAWIASYQGIRAPAGWDPAEADSRPRSDQALLADLLHQRADGESLIDMVVFDEAHYMRNEETSTWRTGSLLRDVSTHQLMLSATPINLGSEDLFNLLRLLDPDHFERPEDFHNVVLANRPVVAASDAVRNPAVEGADIVAAIRAIKDSPWFQDSQRIDRLIEEAGAVQVWTSERRVQVAAKLERLNLLAHIVSRTRKRDVQSERIVRDATVFETDMTPVEAELYRAITEGTRAYAQARGIEHGFLLSTPQRMVSSCAAALMRSWRDEHPDSDGLDVEIDETGADEDQLHAATTKLKGWLAGSLHRDFKVEDLTRNDSKFSIFSEALRKFLADSVDAKAIVFTTYRGTAQYLVDRLAHQGIGAALLMGGGTFDKGVIVSEFQSDADCRVLVCTDVAAEGVDLQFCRLVVNYDLPWNPMRIEQRIGRIDRIGQKSKRILVWNFVHKDTIDGRILARLTRRIGVFESTLGETEEILGQVRQLEDILLSRHLTPEEETRLIEQVALAIENAKRKQEDLEREAVHLVAHGQQLLAQIDAARIGGRAITHHDLIRYVDGWIRTKPGCRLIAVQGEADAFEIGLAPEAAAELEEFVTGQNIAGSTGLVTGQLRRCRFTDRLTEKPRPGEEIIHRFHPLIRFLSHKTQEGKEHFPLYASRVKSARVRRGRYALLTRVAGFSGVKVEEHLLVSGVDLAEATLLDEGSAEALLDAVRQSGTDWSSVGVEIEADLAIKSVDIAEAGLRRRYADLRDEKSRENADRTDLLLRLLDDHVRKKSEGFSRRIDQHEAVAATLRDAVQRQRRKGLANAERKKLSDFLARMDTRRATLTRKGQTFAADSREICVLLVDVDTEEGRL